MRRRSAADIHATDVARRRLEALSRELGLDAPRDDLDPGHAHEHGSEPADLDRFDSRDRAGDVAVLTREQSPPARRPARTDEAPEPRGGRETSRRAHDPLPHDRSGFGRHALPRLTWRERLGLWLTERSPGSGRQFGAAHLAVVVLLVAASLALGAWHTMRGSVEQAPVAAPTLVDPSAGGGGAGDDAAAPGSGAAPGAGEPAGAPTSGVEPVAGVEGASEGPEVVVDVVGRVRRPGIAVLPAGSRVVDALEAAGGARPGVRTDSLNLARPLADGEQIVVGRAAAVSAPPAATGTTSAAPAPGATPTALVDLNTADQVALETLPGVGPVTAAAILQWRTEHGGFTAVEELLEVSGIGDATLAEIAPHVTI